jgi:hypothetical protein
MRPSALGGQASLVGAAVLPFRDLFDLGEFPALRKMPAKRLRSAPA